MLTRTRQYCWLLILLCTLLFRGMAYGREFHVRERFIADTRHPKYVPEEILVAFKPGVSDKEKYEIHERCGSTAAYPVYGGRFERAKFGKGKGVEEMVAAYEREPGVYYAEPNYIARALFVPNDPLYSYQWHFHSPREDLSMFAPGGANLELAWDISTGKGVIVAIIDTGVAYEDYRQFRQASDLAGVNFVPGYDYVDSDSHPNDEDGHGTLVAGVIAQRTNNGMGLAGAAFDCSIMPIRVLDEDGYGTYSSIAAGVYFAVDNGAKVINLSLGGDEPSITLKLSLALAHDKGVTLVVAGGNEYIIGSPPSYPAAYDTFCISVGAVRYDGRRAWYSTRADYIDISAPGGDLSVDQNGDGYPDGILQQSFEEDPRDIDYFYGEGTSFAAPHVSAAAAMLISLGFSDPDEIARVLTVSARDMGKPEWDSEYGWGILDVHTALKYASKMMIEQEDTGPKLINRHGRLAVALTDHDNDSENSGAHPGSKDRSDDILDEDAQVNIASSCDLIAGLDTNGPPDAIVLYQNYPNPFNSGTWIPYQLNEEARARMSIYTSRGELIRTLNLGYKPAGFYISKGKAAYWDGKNEAGDRAASGVYFYTIQAGDFAATKKMVVAQ